MSKDWNFSFDKDGVNNTNIVIGTTALYADNHDLSKLRQIEELEYERDLLIDKYYAEMCNAHIPPWFREDILDDLFSMDKDICSLARKHFLKMCFTDEFLKKFKIEFIEIRKHGYGRTAATVMLCLKVEKELERIGQSICDVKGSGNCWSKINLALAEVREAVCETYRMRTGD